MSIVFENSIGYFISHKRYIDSLYQEVDTGSKGRYKLNPGLFEILTPYRSSKSILENVNSIESNQLELDINYVNEKYKIFQEELLKRNIIFLDRNQNKNVKALNIAQNIYIESTNHNVTNAFGVNNLPATIKEINNSKFLFPINCTFYAKDVLYINKHLADKKYDLILLDPPWWNKYIRRKRKKSDYAYHMMYNDDLKNIPIEWLLKEKGIVVVWCTNSQQNLDTLKSDIFKKWNVKFVTKWFWLKVTKYGEPICSFSKPPGKQPFEQIIFGGRNVSWTEEDKNKIIVSIPSALHSHKPPLIEVLKKFLPESPDCLEIFARYLLPGWTSFGNEVLKLQHESLFAIS